MSGEAYELPETRMELREPALDPIEEGRGSLGGGANSDDNIFVHIATEAGPVSGLTGGVDDKTSVNSLTTTSRWLLQFFNTHGRTGEGGGVITPGFKKVCCGGV